MGQWKDKKTGKWTAKFQFHNNTCRKKGFKTRKKAREWETGERERLERLENQSGLLRLGDMADEYIAYCQPRLQKNTWRQKHFVYKSFLEFLEGDRPVNEITTKQITDYLNYRASKDGGKSANRDLREIKALFNWGIDQEIIDIRNPCRKMENFPEDPYIPYVPPSEDIDKLRMAANPDERDFIEVLYHTAARRIEATRLTWNDVNFEQLWIRLYTRKRRGGQLEPDYVPMNKTLYGFLYSRWKRRDKSNPHVFQFIEKEIDQMMPNLCAKAGIKPFGFHAIRHYVSSLMNDAGKGIKQIQRILRHKRQSTTEKYLHTIDAALYDAVEALEEKSEKDETVSQVVPREVKKGKGRDG